MNFIKKYFKRKKLEADQNKILLHKKDGNIIYYPEIDGLEIIFDGKNNKVELYEPVGKWKNSRICMQGYGAEFVKKSTNDFSSGISFALYDKSRVSIGKNVSFYGGYIYIEGLTSLVIKDDCLFSDGFYLRTGDGHTILDLNTDKPINPPEDIFISERVWCCNNVSVLKGAKIASDTVVGHKCIVNKIFDKSNCILAGIPADIVRDNISWDKKSYNEYIWLMENNL